MGKHLIVIIALYGNVLFGQNFQLGFRAEANILKMKKSQITSTSITAPTALQVNISYFLAESFALEARLGGELAQENYVGYEGGLLGKYFIWQNKEKVFLTAGIIIHHNVSDSHGTFTLYESTVVMPAIGIGFNPLGAVNIEALFQYGVNQEIANQYEVLDRNYRINHTLNIDWVLKLGAGLSWNL